MSEALPGIDWQGAYARLERARRALEAGGAPGPEEARRILEERAQAFARPRKDVALPAAVLEVLAFSLGKERYGIETTYVAEVLRRPDLTRVPCTPHFVLGVMNHRGRILPVLDLQRLLGRADTGVPAGSRVVTLEACGTCFGILADAVSGAIEVDAEGLAPPPAGLVSAVRSVIRGVTPEMVAVLDVGALVRDSRFVVNEEVG